MTKQTDQSKLEQVAAGLGTSESKVRLAMLGAIFLSIAEFFFYAHGWESVTALYAAIPGAALVAPLLYDSICSDLGMPL